MAIGRFYQPSQTPYVSQFVPERIPAELMIGVLANKQKTYDDTAAKIQSLGDWNINALPGYDTQIRDEYKKDIRLFIDESMDKDLSSPEYARKYLAKVRDLRDDQNLASITSNYNKHQEFIKRYEELRKSNDTYAYADELMNDYLQRYNEYTKPVTGGGMGFKGDIQLGDQNILSGVNIHKEGEQYFDELKANGAEQLNFLEEGLAYKNGWEGITSGRINERAGEVLNQWLNSRAGQQLGSQYDMQHLSGIPSVALSKMTPEQKNKYEQDKFTFIGNELLKIGKGFEFNKTTTNADVAYRDRWGVGKERELMFPQTPVINTAGNTSNIQTNYDVDVSNKIARDQDLAKINWALDNYERAKANPNTPQLKILASLPPSKIKELQDTKYALELQNRDTELKQGNAIKRAYTANDKNIDPKYVDEYGEFKFSDFNPYDLSSNFREYNTELKAIDKSFTDNYNRIFNMFKDHGFNTEYVGTQPVVASLADNYNKGISIINNLKKKPNLTESDKLMLNMYEQKFRINSTNIWRNIPEKYTNGAAGFETFNKAMKTHYNDSDTWVPNNQLRSEDKINVYNSTYDKIGKPTVSADYVMEQYLGKAFNDNVVMIGDKVFQPGEYGHPLSNGNAKIISSRVDKINGVDTPVFEVSADYIEDIKKPHYDTKGEIDSMRDATKVSRRQYTVIAKGVNANDYNKTKAKENISIYMADPKSATAQTALINGIKYKYPQLSSGLTELYGLKHGDKTIVDINNPQLGDDGKFIWEVQKRTDYGDYVVKLIDPETGASQTERYGNEHELSNAYLKYNGINLDEILAQ